MREYIRLVESMAQPCYMRVIAQDSNFDKIVSRFDSCAHTSNILFRGGLPDMTKSDAFYTDYVGHAEQYGDHIEAFLTDFTDFIHMSDDRFNELREMFRNNKEMLKQAFATDRHFTNSTKAVRIIKSSNPFSDISSDYSNTDCLIPLFRFFALSKGKNGVVWLGGDYGEYGGQNEYYVIDHTKMKNLRDIHAQYWKENGNHEK